MRCLVCSKPIPPTRHYCDRCAKYFAVRRDQLKRRAALRAAYDPDIDAFRCHWTRVPLDELDPNDPLYISFDHLEPVREATLVVTSELVNSMKFELGPKEFPLAVRELAAHRAGRSTGTASRSRTGA